MWLAYQQSCKSCHHHWAWNRLGLPLYDRAKICAFLLAQQPHWIPTSTCQTRDNQRHLAPIPLWPWAVARLRSAPYHWWNFLITGGCHTQSCARDYSWEQASKAMNEFIVGTVRFKLLWLYIPPKKKIAYNQDIDSKKRWLNGVIRKIHYELFVMKRRKLFRIRKNYYRKKRKKIVPKQKND